MKKGETVMASKKKDTKAFKTSLREAVKFARGKKAKVKVETLSIKTRRRVRVRGKK